MRLSYATFTDPGSRSNNEDSFGVIAENNIELGANPQFFAVADGLGGHSSGEVASRIAIEQAVAVFKMDPDDLSACFESGQEAILKQQAEDTRSKDMKTTLVVLRIAKSKARWGHIGDSRLYRFVDGRMHSHTLDHSVPQILVATGEIREQDIRYHEDRNRLLKVMGAEWPTPRYELAEEVHLGCNESFLLVTDGFWEYVTEKDMERTLRSANTPDQWIEKMRKIAQKNARGCDRDNFTAIAVFVR